MRYKLNTLVSLVMLMSLMSCNKSQEQILSTDELPKNVRAQIEAHFPDQSVIMAKWDREQIYNTYEIELSGGIVLDFNQHGELSGIAAEQGAISTLTISETLLEYVGENYPKNFIIEWELTKYGQEFTLDDDTRLILSRSGQLVVVNRD